MTPKSILSVGMESRSPKSLFTHTFSLFMKKISRWSLLLEEADHSHVS